MSQFFSTFQSSFYGRGSRHWENEFETLIFVLLEPPKLELPENFGWFQQLQRMNLFLLEERVTNIPMHGYRPNLHHPDRVSTKYILGYQRSW